MSALAPTFSSSPGRRLAAPALTLGTFFAASSVPTPLYRLYQEAWGFSSTMLTLVFAIYAFCLLAALLTMGGLSDHLGRRPVIVGAIALEAVSIVVFAFASGVDGLIAARALQGLATGVATAAIGASLLDIDRVHGSLINALAPVLGMAVGGLAAGELALIAPLQLSYWLLLAAFAVAAAAMLRQPESATRRPGALASLRPRVRIPVAARAAMVGVAPISVAVWALGGFNLSLGPSLLREATGSTGAGGWMVFIITTSAAAGMWLLRALPALRLLQTGAVALVVGLAGLLAGIVAHSLLAMLGASVLAGLGFGVGFQGALRSVLGLAQPHERASLLAAFTIMNYLAFSLPSIGVGLLTQRVGLVPASCGYCLLLIVLGLASLLASLRRKPQ